MKNPDKASVVGIEQRQRREIYQPGHRPGLRQNKEPRAEVPAYSSVPNIPLIEFNPVSRQKYPVFFLKTASAMVLFLRVNVADEGIEIGWSY